MNIYKTNCKYGYSILNEKPHKLDTSADYTIIGESIYFSNCVIIKRIDSLSFDGKIQWIVPKNCLTLTHV